MIHWCWTKSRMSISHSPRALRKRSAPSAGWRRISLNGTKFLGPTIIHYGTEEQKKRHLPGIAKGETLWVQGYSEPNSGSDLASLQTRAVEDGDEWVINGQKIWSSYGHYSDWCFMLARTDPDAPKHRGISYFLVDMKTPGLTVKPLINMA